MNSKKDKMKYKANFVVDAEEDLFQIYKYVYLKDSEVQAEKLYSKLYERCLLLQEFPERGHKLPELDLLNIEDFLEIH